MRVCFSFLRKQKSVLQQSQSAFHLQGKNRLFRWEIKWNHPFHWKLFGKKEYLQRYYLITSVSVAFAKTRKFVQRARSTIEHLLVESFPIDAKFLSIVEKGRFHSGSESFSAFNFLPQVSHSIATFLFVTRISRCY